MTMAHWNVLLFPSPGYIFFSGTAASSVEASPWPLLSPSLLSHLFHHVFSEFICRGPWVLCAFAWSSVWCAHHSNCLAPVSFLLLEEKSQKKSVATYRDVRIVLFSSILSRRMIPDWMAAFWSTVECRDVHMQRFWWTLVPFWCDWFLLEKKKSYWIIFIGPNEVCLF